MRLGSLFLMVVIGGCAGGGDGKADGAEDDTGSATDDTGSAPDLNPSIVSIDSVECTTQQSAGEVWQLALSVTDPQGIDTVAGGSVDVLNEAGGALATYVIACNDGACFGSFRADYDGISCALDGTISFAFVVEDEDGNVSATMTYDTAAR